MATTTTHASDIVADPVGHISISGVHGRKELNERLARATPQRLSNSDYGIGSAFGTILLGAAAGALIVYFFDRTR